MKRKIQSDISAVAPIIWGLLIVGGLVASYGVYSYFQEPDVVYNISEGGLFSIAGLEIGGLELVAIIVSVVIVIALIFKNRKG